MEDLCQQNCKKLEEVGQEVNNHNENYENRDVRNTDISRDIIDNYFDKIFAIDVLFQQIQSFLNCSNTSMNNLLNTSRSFQVLKRTKFYWNLNRNYSAKYHNKNYSLKFYGEISFKDRLDFLLTNTRTQLSLNLSSFMCLSNVNTLGHVHTLNLSRTKIKDVDALGMYLHFTRL